MSKFLLDVAEPLLRWIDPSVDAANYEAALLLGAALWNASPPGTESDKRMIFTAARKRDSTLA